MKVEKSRKRTFKIGDIVRLIEILPEDRDPTLVDDPEMRTHELFRFCLGRTFKVRGFDQYGHLELRADEDAVVRKKFGRYHTIWVEPDHVKRARVRKSGKH